MSSSSRLLDLPTAILSDILWTAWEVMPLVEWLNLKAVSHIFFEEIEHLMVVHEPLHKEKMPRLKRDAKHASEMPPKQYARYLYNKVMRFSDGSVACFSQLVHCAATKLLQHEENHGMLSTVGINSKQRYNEIMYLLCEACALDSNQSGCCERPLSWDLVSFDTLTASEEALAVAAGAAYLGIENFDYSHDLVRIERHANELLPLRCIDSYGERRPANYFRGVLPAACKGGNTNIVRLLLDNGHVPDRWCRSQAICQGHLEIVKILSQPGKLPPVDRWYRQHIEREVMIAFEQGHSDIVNFLLPAREAIPEYVDEFRGSAICEAARNGHINLVRQVLDMGWDPESLGGYHHISVLENACRCGRPEIVALLLERGAKPHSRSRTAPMAEAGVSGHLGIMQQLLRAGVDVNQYHGQWLFQPCVYGRLNAVRFLFENGYKIPQDVTFWVDMAITRAERGGYSSIVEFLTNHGADLNRSKEALTPGKEIPIGVYFHAH